MIKTFHEHVAGTGYEFMKIRWLVFLYLKMSRLSFSKLKNLVNTVQRKALISVFSATFLIGCLLFPFIGPFTSMKYRQYHLRKEIKQSIIRGMDRDKLVLLKIPVDDIAISLKWEHSREFCYQEEMYDVVEKETKGDTMLYWCWLDCEETELNRKLSSLVENAFGNDPDRKNEKNRMKNYFKVFYANTVVHWDSTLYDVCVHFRGCCKDIYFPPCLPCLFPPPEQS